MGVVEKEKKNTRRKAHHIITTRSFCLRRIGTKGKRLKTTQRPDENKSSQLSPGIFGHMQTGGHNRYRNGSGKTLIPARTNNMLYQFAPSPLDN
jgi:hypothetical protein